MPLGESVNHREEADSMATSSFFGYVEIDTKERVDAFVKALEDSANKPEQKTVLSHPTSDGDSQWIKANLSPQTTR
jgi:hypothetical protein